MLQMYVLIKIKINKKQFMFINIKIVNGINKLTNSATIVVITLLKVLFKWILRKNQNLSPLVLTFWKQLKKNKKIVNKTKIQK